MENNLQTNEAFLIEQECKSNGTTWFDDGANIHFTPSPKTYLNYPEIISQIAVQLTIGQGLIFNGPIETINRLNTWMREQNVLDTLRKSEKQNSKYGKSIIFLTPTNNGKDISLSFSKLIVNSRVATINGLEQAGEVWQNQLVGDSPMWIHIKYFKDKIVVEKYLDNGEMRLGSVETKIQDNQMPVEVYEIPNDMGMIPIFETENLPVINFTNSTMLNYRPDWLVCKDMIDFLNDVIRILGVEVKANRTRMLMDLSISDMKKLQDQGSIDFEDFKRDIWINASLGNTYGNSMTNSSTSILQGNPKFMEYTDLIATINNLIFNMSGYTTPGDTGKNSTYENKTNSLFANKLDKQTTDYKQALRKPVYYRIFDYVLKFYGIDPFDETGERTYSFAFNNVAISDTIRETQIATELLENTLISRAEARARVLNEPITVAMNAIDEIDAEMIAYQQTMTENGLQPDQEQGNSWDKRDDDRKQDSFDRRTKVDN